METGLPLYRCEDVRAIDRAAIERDGIPAFELMSRAAHAALALLRSTWPDAHSIAVWCGAGNNGGDGFVLARLALAAGMPVRVFAAADAEPSTAEARRARDEWRATGGVLESISDGMQMPEADLVVDALLGIGLTRAASGAMAHAIESINASGTPVLALDVPSGLDADRGRAAGAVVRATRTLCFVAPKRGLFTGAAREWCGDVSIDTLGIDAATRARHAPDAWLLRPHDLGRWLRPRPRDAHKGRHGHVLAIGGDHGMGGAIALCAQAALRCGAGLVSVATRVEHATASISTRPEAMVHAVEDGTALDALLARAPVLALGPGLGQSDWGRAMYRRALSSALPAVLDADALNLLAREPSVLPHAILTPHPGEAARLLQVDVEAIEADRFAAVRALAERYRATVVLKGAGSLVASPGRAPCVIDAGNPGMAGGGQGDVLTGVIAALLAQGLASHDAACAGALLHASAGDAAARAGGERGLLASDLFEPLRRLANPT